MTFISEAFSMVTHPKVLKSRIGVSTLLANSLETKVAWFAQTPQGPSVDQFAVSLGSEEKSRLSRLRQSEDQWSYAAAHRLMREMLSSRYGVAPEDWRFCHDQHGRPHVDPKEHPEIETIFSISHTQGLALCALLDSDRAEFSPVGVGVDAEYSSRKVEALDLAERFFAPAEAKLLRDLDPEEREQTFFHLWTLKEAIVKALGLGLRQDLASFACHVDPPTLVMADDVLLPLDGWTLVQLDLGEGYVGALAVRRPPHIHPHVTVHGMTGSALLGGQKSA